MAEKIQDPDSKASALLAVAEAAARERNWALARRAALASQDEADKLRYLAYILQIRYGYSSE
jgi:hypothetical protein